MNFQLVLTGLGGQGLLTLVKFLANICQHSKIPFLATETHGLSQRGGSVISFVRMGNFSAPLIPPGHADAVLSLDYNEGLRCIHYLSDSGTCYSVINKDPNNALTTTANHFTVDAVNALQHAGIPLSSLNVYMLAVFMRDQEWHISDKELNDAIRKTNAKHAEAIYQTFSLAYNADMFGDSQQLTTVVA